MGCAFHGHIDRRACPGRRTASLRRRRAGGILVRAAIAGSCAIALAASTANAQQLPDSITGDVTTQEQTDTHENLVERLKLADAPRVERQTIKALLDSDHWIRRAIAAVRLERYDCPDSLTILDNLMSDQSWQVRVFTTRTLGRARAPQAETWFDGEENGRVLRTALRHRYRIDPDLLDRGVRTLCKSRSLERMLLGAELGAASGIEQLKELATKTARSIILRMDRHSGGRLSPRLARLTGGEDHRRHTRWQAWLRRQRGTFAAHPAYMVSESADDPTPISALAQLDPERFSDLEQYIETLADRSVDLCVVIDCTASMWGELAEAQGGIDDLMTFMSDVVQSLRVAVMAYRDRRDDFETKGWPFSTDIEETRTRLWSLSASGGGDTPEAVYKALREAYTGLNWRTDHTRILVVIGDAPPHVGYGGYCIEMARKAAANDCTTHVVQAAGKDVKHFPEIAEAGGGRAVLLADNDSLVAEIAGLTLGDRFDDEFRQLFREYLALCQ